MSGRTVTPIRSAAVDGVGVFKVTTTDEAGWESPAWYCYRPHEGGFTVCRLGSARTYAVELAPRAEHPARSRCECLGKESGRAVCRHIGALWTLRERGKL